MMSFNIYVQNSRSIRGKLAEFTQGLLLHDYHVVAICENWLLDSVGDPEVADGRYDVHRRDRAVERAVARRGGGARAVGGGVMLLTRRELMARPLAPPAPPSAVYDAVHVVLPSCALGAPRDLHVVCVYLPGAGPSHDEQVEHLTVYMSEFIRNHPNADYLLVGDFNFSDIEWNCDPDRLSRLPLSVSNAFQRSFLDALSSYGLDQYNTISNGNSRYLDLAFCTQEVISTRCTFPLTREDMPHHPAIELELPNLILRNRLKDPKHRIYNFKKANYDAIRSRLRSLDWQAKFGYKDVNDILSCFYYELQCIIEDEVPFSMSNGGSYPVWFSKPLIKIIKEKSKYHRLWKRYGNPLDYNSFCLLRRRQKEIQEECWKRYLKGCENAIAVDPKRFWSYSNSIRRNRGIPAQVSFGDCLASSGPDICNAFSRFFLSVYTRSLSPHQICHDSIASNFINVIGSISVTRSLVTKYLKRLDRNKGAGSDGIPSVFAKLCAEELASPLTLIFKRSVQDGIFPEKWKEAFVTPIHKSGSKQKVENYRPVSILSVFGKVFESIVYDQLYPVAAAYIPSSQHGFMRKRSAVSNLAVFTDSVARHMDGGSQVDVVYTDYSKCFDRIDHGILINKLLGIGVHGDLLRWLISYLRNRLQAVRVGVYKSNFEVIPSGVPQGSHLGPLLFNIYLHDISACFMHAKVLMYADDKKIYMPIHCPADCYRLQADLDRLSAYCVRNRLELNVDKCQTISFTRKRYSILHNYNLNGVMIPRVYLVRDLGVMLDNKLLYISHFEYITQRAYRMLGFLHRSCKSFRKVESIKTLYFAYVRSIMEYASPIWSPSYVTHIARLESVQRCFVRRLSYRFGGHVSYVERLTFFHMQSLEHRRLMSDMKLLFDVINALLDCPELTERIGVCACTTRTRRMRSLCVGSARSNYARHSVLHRIVHLYETRFRNVDIFFVTRNKFLRAIGGNLPIIYA